MIQSIDNVLVELSLNDLTPSIQRMILKNYVESIIDECADSAETGYDSAYNVNIDKESILKIKQLL